MIERQEIVGDPRDSLASWLRPDGSRRYVPATTICWWPRRPQFMRARREGVETVLRCYACPGCREFEAQRLARRFVATYRARSAAAASSQTGLCLLRISNKVSSSPQLFAVRVYCPKELHASTARNARRARGVDVVFGFVRAGVESFMLVTSSIAELGAWLLRRRLRFDFRPIGNPTRARSWRWLVRGLIVARSVYGENINRWYCLGLAKAEKLKWEVENIGVYQPYNRAEDPRSTSRDLGTLRPPAMWRLPRGVRVRVDSRLRSALSPETVTQLMPELQAMVARIGKGRAQAYQPLTSEEVERNRRAYQHVARAESEALINAKLSDLSSPPLVRGVSEVLDNSSSFKERTRRRAEAMMRAPPDDPAIVRAEAEAAEAAEKARRDRSDLRNRKRLDDELAKLRAHMERLRRDSDR